MSGDPHNNRCQRIDLVVSSELSLAVRQIRSNNRWEITASQLRGNRLWDFGDFSASISIYNARGSTSMKAISDHLLRK